MPVPIMLAITMEHAVPKPMLRFGAAAGCAETSGLTVLIHLSIVAFAFIIRESIFRNVRHPVLRSSHNCGVSLGWDECTSEASEDTTGHVAVFLANRFRVLARVWPCDVEKRVTRSTDRQDEFEWIVPSGVTRQSSSIPDCQLQCNRPSNRSSDETRQSIGVHFELGGYHKHHDHAEP